MAIIKLILHTITKEKNCVGKTNQFTYSTVDMGKFLR